MDPSQSFVSILVLFLGLALYPLGVRAQRVTLSASDGELIHGTWARADDTSLAVILAFHQGGASGEAEYGAIAQTLVAEGYDVLMMDQRSGGDMFEGVNRTVRDRGGRSVTFCEASADLAGALTYVRNVAPNRRVILWGSSYSAALALRLAASNPDGVIGVLAFSPASGGPMVQCRGEDMSQGIRVPTLVLRPRSEMERESSIQQFALFREQGHQVYVADPGVHGSSMLVEERVGSSTEATWQVVLGFLRKAVR